MPPRCWNERRPSLSNFLEAKRAKGRTPRLPGAVREFSMDSKRYWGHCTVCITKYGEGGSGSLSTFALRRRSSFRAQPARSSLS
eukprot:scaffold308095_cov32-Tisochrysis_lutea.AAC.3